MSKQSNHAAPAPSSGHTIAVVAERTGLSRDVLRVWERRYRAVEPQRSAGGQRLYSDDDLHRFQLLAHATRNGRTIGSVAALSTDALGKLVADDISHAAVAPAERPAVPWEAQQEVVELALVHALALDTSSLERELRRAIGRHGLPTFLETVVPSLMHRIGDEWVAERLAIPHEHLASAVVLAILLDAVRAIPETPGAPRLLVATPVGEQHVLGAALIAAAAALDGWSILFLGANVPSADLAMAARGVRAVALSVVHPQDGPHAMREVLALRAALPSGIPIVVGGAVAVRLRDTLAESGVSVCRDVAEARVVFARTLRADGVTPV